MDLILTHEIDLQFENCDSFSEYQPVVGKLSEKATCSKNMVVDTPVETVSIMVTIN